MKSVKKILLSEMQNELIENLRSLKNQITQEYCFAFWLLEPKKGEYIFGKVSDNQLEQLFNEAFCLNRYTALSSLGFLLERKKSLGDKAIESFKQGLKRLMGRQASGIAGVSSDYIALLGICCGAAYKRGSATALSTTKQINSIGDWFKKIFAKRIAHQKTTTFEKIILSCSMQRIGINNNQISYRITTPKEHALAWALSTKGFHELFEFTEKSAESVIKYLLSGTYKIEDKPTHAILLSAFDSICKASAQLNISRPQIEDVIKLLGRFENSMRRWCYEEKPRSKWTGTKPVRWYIDNEYHVQDILWVILSPIFEDLEDEENLPSLGQKHPRYDLGIPSLGLIIEVKYVRYQRDFAGVIEQVAADSSLYLSKTPKYKKIIAFVYDDTGSTEQHQECKDGLLSLNGVIAAILVSCPGKMPDIDERRELIKQLPE